MTDAVLFSLHELERYAFGPPPGEEADDEDPMMRIINLTQELARRTMDREFDERFKLDPDDRAACSIGITALGIAKAYEFNRTLAAQPENLDGRD